MKELITLSLFSILVIGCSEKKTSDEQDIPTTESVLKIAYNVLDDTASEDYEIYVMNTDGTGKTNVSNNPGVDWVYYAWKDKIYFVSDRDSTYRKYFLYEMNADGSEVRRISKFLVVDSWLSGRNDGTEFIVTTIENDNKRFVLIDKEGNILQNILTPEYAINDPYFSPDGSQIVFRSYESGRDELWIMDVDDTASRKQLTRYPRGDTARRGYHAGPPVWEPNRNIISYISKRGDNHQIFTTSSDRSARSILTTGELHYGWHSWSPDGNTIALESGDINFENIDIYLMDFETGEMTQLTDSWKLEQAPVFVLAEE